MNGYGVGGASVPFHFVLREELWRNRRQTGRSLTFSKSLAIGPVALNKLALGGRVTRNSEQIDSTKSGLPERHVGLGANAASQRVGLWGDHTTPVDAKRLALRRLLTGTRHPIVLVLDGQSGASSQPNVTDRFVPGR